MSTQTASLTAGLETESWQTLQYELDDARRMLAVATDRESRQTAYDRIALARRRATRHVHGWLAQALELRPVERSRLVLSLDVDGVLEDESDGWSATSVAGAAALRLLQLGHVAVVLNSGRDLVDLQDRVAQLKLMGGVGAFGAVVWDGVYQEERILLSEAGRADLDRLRGYLATDSSLVFNNPSHHTVRVGRVVGDATAAITGEEARRWLDKLNLAGLGYWVAPGHTNFVDRRVDKRRGLFSLLADLGLCSLPVAAMGDSACDLPVLRAATLVAVPAGALREYTARSGQQVFRGSSESSHCVWEAACWLVPNLGLQRQVRRQVDGLRFPAWLPATVQAGREGPGIIRRLGSVIDSVRRSN